MTTSTSPALRILKLSTCRTLSEQSDLTYQIAADAGQQLYLRITGNSSSGRYAKEAFPLAHIQSILAGIDPSTPFTSACLQPAFVGRSQNMAGFAMALLLAEGLVEYVSQEDRRFRCADGSAFFSAINALIANGTSLLDGTPATPTEPDSNAAAKKFKRLPKSVSTPAE